MASKGSATHTFSDNDAGSPEILEAYPMSGVPNFSAKSTEKLTNELALADNLSVREMGGLKLPRVEGFSREVLDEAVGEC